MRKLFKSLLATILILAMTVSGFIFYRGYREYRSITANAPIVQKAYEIMNSPEFVPYDQLPPALLQATVAIEDHRFYNHGGIDYIGLARAIASQVVPGMVISGGSTITQQTAKNMYGLFHSSLDRKGAEIFMAKQLENHFTKDQILALYVNIINYGNNYVGIYQAATGYFGLLPSQLSEAQCTLLAGIPQSPGNFQLTDHFEQAKHRQLEVLHAMVEYGYLTQEQADIIYNTPV